MAEVGRWGQPRREHSFVIAEPRRFLELVRERVTASVVLVRHAPVVGRRGVRVIARRAPAGDGELSWIYEYDAGIDPDDPTVRLAAESHLGPGSRGGRPRPVTPPAGRVARFARPRASC